jgi:predicted RNase H-like HicB family nuclease
MQFYLKKSIFVKNKKMIATKKMRFPIIIEQDEDSMYIVSCPQFKGCHAQGKTIDEALNNIREVIELCLDDINENQSNNYIGIRDLEIMIPAKA